MRKPSSAGRAQGPSVPLWGHALIVLFGIVAGAHVIMYSAHGSADPCKAAVNRLIKEQSGSDAEAALSYLFAGPATRMIASEGVATCYRIALFGDPRATAAVMSRWEQGGSLPGAGEVRDQVGVQDPRPTPRNAQQVPVPSEQYMDMIREKIWRHWRRPEAADPQTATAVRILVDETGVVLVVFVAGTSGDESFDGSIQKAILAASPLPIPLDPERNLQFRNLRINFSPD